MKPFDIVRYTNNKGKTSLNEIVKIKGEVVTLTNRSGRYFNTNKTKVEVVYDNN